MWWGLGVISCALPRGIYGHDELDCKWGTRRAHKRLEGTERDRRENYKDRWREKEL